MQTDILFQNTSLLSAETASSIKPQLRFPVSNLFIFSPSTDSLQLNSRPLFKLIWTGEEKLKYSIFVCYFRQIFKELNIKKSNWEIFKGMSKFVETKNPRQCRSHHLKLQREFNGITKFLKQATKRVHKMAEKIHHAQRILVEIQNEFDLYLEQNIYAFRSHQQSEHMQSQAMRLTSNQNQAFYLNQKINKQDLIKTVDDYAAQLNPGQYAISYFNRLPQSFLQTPKKFNSNRLSLPSFENVDDPAEQNKKFMKQQKFSLENPNVEKNLIEDRGKLKEKNQIKNVFSIGSAYST